MEGKAASGLRSQRARPEAPCSRRAVAVSRARAPAPPVTVGGVRGVYEGEEGEAGSHGLITFPVTENRYCALCAAERLSGGSFGAVSGLSSVESVISGNCLAVKDSLSSASSAMLETRYIYILFNRLQLKQFRINYAAESSARERITGKF